MRPPRWHRDEIILALDLYRTIEPKEMDNRNPKVIELSELLNRLHSPCSTFISMNNILFFKYIYYYYFKLDI